jgi:hypothetical protein
MLVWIFLIYFNRSQGLHSLMVFKTGMNSPFSLSAGIGFQVLFKKIAQNYLLIQTA